MVPPIFTQCLGDVLRGNTGQGCFSLCIRYPRNDLSGLPPTYIVLGTADLLRDECIEYAQRLMTANVPTELAVFPGLFHGAEYLVPAVAVSRRMQQSMIAALKNGLETP